MQTSDPAYLELIILGAGPAYSDVPGSLGAGYLLRSGSDALVLDLGQGCFPSLASTAEPSGLAGVFISHLHPDHFIDLIPLRHYLRRAESTATGRLPVMASDGLDGRLDGAWGEPGFFAAAFDHQQLVAGVQSMGPFRLEARRVRHAGEAWAVRVDLLGIEGRGLVYTGDVAEAEDVRPLIREGDLLLGEASYGAGPVPDGMPHLDGPTLAQLAADSGAGQLVVTHVRMGTDLQATMKAVRDAFDGPASLARPGARYLV